MRGSQLRNLAASSEHRGVLEEMREGLNQALDSLQDPRRQGVNPWDTYPFTDQRIFGNPEWRREGFSTALP